MMHLYVSHHFLLPLEEPSSSDISPTFLQSNGNVSNDFHFFGWFSLSELKWHVYYAGFLALPRFQVLRLQFTYNCKNDDASLAICVLQRRDKPLFLHMQEDIIRAILVFATQEEVFVLQMFFQRQ